MKRNRRLAITLALYCLLFIAAVIVVFVLVRLQVDHSQAKWCDTLNLLTSRPVPKPTNPSANPSREMSYQLYEDFLTLKHRFGC